MELAVNMPEQEPQVGQAACSIADFVRRVRSSAASTMASTRSTARSWPSILTLPASIGPPETKTTGILSRSAAIIMPGVILSQLEMQTIASAQWRVDHVLDTVGDDFAARQRIEHAVMAHRDAVIDGDGVEFLGHAARRLDLAGDHLAHVLQVHVAGHELGKGVDHRDDRLAEIARPSCLSRAKGRGRRPCCGHGSKCGNGRELPLCASFTVFGRGLPAGRAIINHDEGERPAPI
jgi:hypothetical protein